jgi:hypothetical protein
MGPRNACGYGRSEIVRTGARGDDGPRRVED